MQATAFALENSDYIYFAHCMSSTLAIIKNFTILKFTLVNMMLDVKEMLEKSNVPNQDVQMTDSEDVIDNSKIMWYACVSALAKVKSLDYKTAKSLAIEMLKTPNMTSTEKGQFFTDLILS